MASPGSPPAICCTRDRGGGPRPRQNNKKTETQNLERENFYDPVEVRLTIFKTNLVDKTLVASGKDKSQEPLNPTNSTDFKIKHFKS